MSSKMAAIVGYISDETYTNPAINELVVTSDGFVLLEHVGDVGTNDMIGGESDLLRNWNDLLDAAGLTPEERTEAEAAYQSHVHSFRVA
jgi:aminoglycoside/choline kinase family phosphotransferase